MRKIITSNEEVGLRRRQIDIRAIVQLLFFALIAYFAIGKSLVEIYPA